MLNVILKKSEERRLVTGHRWVFSNEVAFLRREGEERLAPKEAEPGEAAIVRTAQGELLGAAHYNPKALIAARLLGGPHDAQSLIEGELTEEALLRRNIRRAVERRGRIVHPERQAWRVVFSESDDLPGLIVDRYGPVLSVQLLTAGMARNRETVVRGLLETTGAEAAYEKTSGPYLEFEGLEEREGWLHGEVAMPVELSAGGGDPAMSIDLVGAQKTGAYLDQHENRRWLAERLDREKNARLLDLYCYHGHWGIAAARAAANLQVTGLDASAPAVEAARRDADLNGLADRCSFEAGEVFTFLEQAISRGEEWDVIVADPPAFAKSRKAIPPALKGYEKLNTLVAKCVGPEGLLVTCSCSHHIESDPFEQMLVRALRRAGRRAWIVHRGQQSSDHPILAGMRETHYLKMVALQFLD